MLCDCFEDGYFEDVAYHGNIWSVLKIGQINMNLVKRL